MKVVGAGLACLDIINREREIIAMNGGTCANVLSALAQLGEEAIILLPKYENDVQSERFYSTFLDLNVKLIFYGNTKQNIPRIIETFDDNMKHVFYTKCPCCDKELIKNRFITDTEAGKYIEKIKGCDVFFADRISDGIKKIATELKCSSSKVFYEPNSGRNVKALIEMSKISNVLKFSTDRISMSLADNILRECHDTSLELVIATHGQDGLSFCYKKEDNTFSDWIKGPHVEFNKTKDTSGAGDWLTAGFLHYWKQTNFVLSDDKIIDALEKALRLSAIASMAEGAQGLFYDENVYSIIKKQFDIKLESVLEQYVKYNDGSNFCNACLSECCK